MSIWKEIKYSLNSTLGTKKFISIDKLIKGSKAFVSSGGDTIFLKPLDKTLSFDVGNNGVGYSPQSVKIKVTPLLSGSLVLSFNYQITEYYIDPGAPSDWGVRLSLRDVTNGKNLVSLTNPVKDYASQISHIIQVVEGETYEFEVEFSYYGNFTKNSEINICKIINARLSGGIVDSYANIEEV